MSDNNKGLFESAVDKTKEIAHDVKDSVVDTYDKMVGNRTEDKAARNVKEKANKCADRIGEARDATADKMRDAARTIEGH